MSVPYRQWGEGLDEQSVAQMRAACALPVAVRGALMPDAHVGYGLPIGGVLATRNAVIPYAVGVDIACRVKISVLDIPPEELEKRPERFRRAIERETRFGVGSQFQGTRREHAVIGADWTVSPITQQYKDRAHAQLGTSGSGNHFVEFGILSITQDHAHVLGLAPAAAASPTAIRDPQSPTASRQSAIANPPSTIQYLALLTHSGSRGTGAAVCEYYSKLAMSLHGELAGEVRRLAWLDLDSDAGREYWAAMELMGRYASANHACIHEAIARHLGAAVLGGVENHHNFAWKERHGGEELIVHRKGATPAGEGVLGFIPGSMASPGFIVRGRGEADSLRSAAHGAGRVMSRTAAKKTYRWEQVRPLLAERGVTLMSAGLDEVPQVYKDIDAVMAQQADLVEPIARFDPKLVKMAPAGERAED